jgi:hypothetical protein
MVEIAEDDLRKMIEAAQNRQAFFEQAKTWFASSLSESKYKVDQGQMLTETHDAGVALYQQFINDWTKPRTPAPAAEAEKKDETQQD